MTGTVKIQSGLLKPLCEKALNKFPYYDQNGSLKKDIQDILSLCETFYLTELEITLDINTFVKICNLAKG